MLALCSSVPGQKDKSVNQTSASPFLIFIPELYHPACTPSCTCPDILVVPLSVTSRSLPHFPPLPHFFPHSGFLYTAISCCAILSCTLFLFPSLCMLLQQGGFISIFWSPHYKYCDSRTFVFSLCLSPTLVKSRLIRWHCYGTLNK